MPRPRKLRAASTTMADATSSDVCTMIGAVTFGQMWRSMMRPGPAPSARAATTKSRSRTERVCPRTSRAKIGVNTTPMASMALVRPGPRLAAMATASPKPAPRVWSALVRTARSQPTIVLPLPVANARIDEGVEDVGEQVGQQHRQSQDEHNSLQHGKVPEEDGIGGEAAQSREREDGLHDHRAAEQSSRLKADDGDHGNERVPECVPSDDERFP